MHSNLRSLLKACLLTAFALIGFAARAQPAGSTQQTWLMLNPYSQESLMAVDSAEKDQLLKGNWKINGTGNFLLAPRRDTSPVNRLTLANSSGVDRVFSVSSAELSRCIKAGYNNEGVLGFASTKEKEGMTPVYHFTREGKNLFLINPEDRAWAEKNGWKYDAVAFWLWPVDA